MNGEVNVNRLLEKKQSRKIVRFTIWIFCIVLLYVVGITYLRPTHNKTNITTKGVEIETNIPIDSKTNNNITVIKNYPSDTNDRTSKETFKHKPSTKTPTEKKQFEINNPQFNGPTQLGDGNTMNVK